MNWLTKIFHPQFAVPAEIAYDSKDLYDLITRWTSNEGLEPSNFANLLCVIGEEPPFQLSNFNQKERSFDCISCDGHSFRVSLGFGDHFDFCSEIRITVGEKTDIYEVFSTTNKPSEINVTHSGHIILGEDKVLESCYRKDLCHYVLRFSDCRALYVNLNESSDSKTNEIKVLRNTTAVEKYLIGLSAPVNAYDVFTNVMKLLAFSDEDIREADGIAIFYQENEVTQSIVSFCRDAS